MEILGKGYKLEFGKQLNSGPVVQGIVIIVNNPVDAVKIIKNS